MGKKANEKKMKLDFKVIVFKTTADLLSVTLGAEMEQGQSWKFQKTYRMSVSTNSCQLWEKGGFFWLLVMFSCFFFLRGGGGWRCLVLLAAGRRTSPCVAQQAV